MIVRYAIVYRRKRILTTLRQTKIGTAQVGDISEGTLGSVAYLVIAEHMPWGYEFERIVITNDKADQKLFERFA